MKWCRLWFQFAATIATISGDRGEVAAYLTCELDDED
jgi:hypothetical protein